MKLSQLIHAMDREDVIIVNDEGQPVDETCLYRGEVRGIKRDDPLNKRHITKLFAFDDMVVVFTVEPTRRLPHENRRNSTPQPRQR